MKKFKAIVLKQTPEFADFQSFTVTCNICLSRVSFNVEIVIYFLV